MFNERDWAAIRFFIFAGMASVVIIPILLAVIAFLAVSK